MEIVDNKNQETEDIKTSFNRNHILDLYNPLKKKTTDDIIRFTALGLLIPFVIEIFQSRNLLVSRIQNLTCSSLDFVESSKIITFYLIVIFYLFLVASFYKKKKIGWIGLTIFFMPLLGTCLIKLILVISWSIKTLLFDSLTLFDIFNFRNLFSTFGEFIFGIALIFVLNRKDVLLGFKINKTQRIISCCIAFIVVVFWAYKILPDSFQEDNGPRKYLPSDYYNKFDLPVNNNAYFPIRTRNLSVKKLFNQGKKLRMSRDFIGAISYFEEALKLEPYNTDILQALSDAYAHNNNLRIAITFLDKAISIDSMDLGLYNNRGLLYYKLCENNKALLDFNKALQIDSTNSTVYLNLTLVYYYKNMKDKSFESIKKAEKYGANQMTVNKYKELIEFTDDYK